MGVREGEIIFYGWTWENKRKREQDKKAWCVLFFIWMAKRLCVLVLGLKISQGDWIFMERKWKGISEIGCFWRGKKIKTGE